MSLQCNPDSLNTVDKICNPRTGRWVNQTSDIGKRLMINLKQKQPKMIKVRIGNKPRQLLRIGYNKYALIPLIQPKKIFDLEDTYNKLYCGKNINIYDLTTYSKFNNHDNPYGYSGIDNGYNCLTKGLFIGSRN